MNLRPPWQKAISRAGKAGAPREVCGVIVDNGEGDLEAVQLQNVHTDPLHHFLLEPGRYLELYRAGVVRAYWHTHPEGPAEFSPSDRAFCDESGLPCFLYSVPGDAMLEMTPVGWTQELEGRIFLPGINDCFSLVRDYYERTLGLVGLPNPPRRAEYLLGGFPPEVLEDVLDRANFYRVDHARTHDLLLLDNRSITGRPNHAAVMVEPGIILHQLCHAPSRRDVYGGHLADSTLLIYRPRRCSPPSTSTANSAMPLAAPYGPSA